MAREDGLTRKNRRNGTKGKLGRAKDKIAYLRNFRNGVKLKKV